MLCGQILRKGRSANSPLSVRVLPAFRALRVWMTIGLSTKFFHRARTPLADEACDHARILVCDAHFVKRFDRSCSQLGNSAEYQWFGKARIPRQLLEICWRDFI